jgi:hypothetical protein
MKLLGFKDHSFLKDYFNIQSALFLVPDESLVTGSCSLFAHLIERLYSRNMIAMCSLVARERSNIKMVALIPQVTYN